MGSLLLSGILTAALEQRTLAQICLIEVLIIPKPLILYILMNSSIWFDAMNLGCFIVNIKGLQVRTL